MKKKLLWILCAVAAAWAVCCTAWVFIHRRAIRAAIRHEPIPACPHWLPACLREKLVNTEPAPAPEE